MTLDRVRVACDRGLIAWIGTATFLITIGFFIYKVDRSWFDSQMIGPREFSVLMVGAGLILLMLATLEHRREMRVMRSEYPEMPRSPAGMVAALILALGDLDNDRGYLPAMMSNVAVNSQQKSTRRLW